MPGRALKWYTTIARDQPIAAGAQANHGILGTLDVGVHKGATVTRILGRVEMGTDTLVTDGFLSFGAIILNTDAVIAGALPDPQTAADNADWLFRDELHTRMSSLSDGSQLARGVYDIRSQRILRSEQDVLHLVVAASGVGLEYNIFIRVLLRLP